MSSDSEKIKLIALGAGLTAVGISAGFWLGNRRSAAKFQQSGEKGATTSVLTTPNGSQSVLTFEQPKHEPSTPRDSFFPPTPRRKASFYDEEVGEGAIIVVDPLSSGAMLAAEFANRHFQVVRLMSQKFPERFANFVPPAARNLKYLCNFEFKDSSKFDQDVDLVVDQIRQMDIPVQAVVAGAETGVEVCDAIAQRLGLPNNGPSMSHVRRDKFLMGEQVRRAGIRAVKQAKCTTWAEVEAFVKEFNPVPFQVIIKPLDSAGSDNVACCRDMTRLKAMFDKIMGKENVLGQINKAVVLQEFLKGKEYVVDTVSRFGKHKVVAVWEYDKRPENGADFVYFGMRLCSGDTPLSKILVSYMLKVLDALNIVNSCGHGEVMMTDTGPCLVECGARPHGGEAIWAPMSQACLGYTQLTVCIFANVSPQRFRCIPDIPVLGNKHAMEVMFVCRKAGTLIALPKIEEMKALKSYHSHLLDCRIGKRMEVTTDYLTTPGSVVLIATSKDALEVDALAIRKMELDGFFVMQ